MARVQVTEELLAWADDIFVMERRLTKMLHRRFLTTLTNRKVISLEIPDDYQCMQPTLLADQLTLHLGNWKAGLSDPTGESLA